MVGFDMDHTLAPYNRDAFEDLAFRCTVEKFVDAGYPQDLLKLQYRPNFLIRGLLVDAERGNLLKVDSHKYVKIAYHGHRQLSKAERHDLYNKQSFKAVGFVSVDTLFALSEVQLFVEIVDYMENHPGRIAKSFREVYADLRTFIDLSHQDGSIKSKVIANPEKYVLKDKYLGNSLVRLIDSGKHIFLLTNSIFDYTNVVMEYVLGDAHEDFSNWKDYFDIVIVGSGKPGFFLGSQPFFEVVEESNLLRIHDSSFVPGKIYHGGNARLFEKLTGYLGDEILYVGDHIYGDIIQSKGSLNWRTLVIIEELAQEVETLRETRADLKTIEQMVGDKESQDEEIQKARSKIAAINRQIEKAKKRGDSRRIQVLLGDYSRGKDLVKQLSDELASIENQIRQLIHQREARFHPLWGGIMQVGLERSRFADQVGAYACLYTSRVSNLRFYGPHKKFISFHQALPHDI